MGPPSPPPPPPVGCATRLLAHDSFYYSIQRTSVGLIPTKLIHKTSGGSTIEWRDHPEVVSFPVPIVESISSTSPCSQWWYDIGFISSTSSLFFYVNIEVTCPTPFQQVDPCHIRDQLSLVTLRVLAAWLDTGRARMGTAIGPRFLAFHCGRSVCQVKTC